MKELADWKRLAERRVNRLERMVMKRPEMVGKPLPCPFCGDAPRVFWNGGMVIRCVNVDCLRPRTVWSCDVDKCVAQWNMRSNVESTGVLKVLGE